MIQFVSLEMEKQRGSGELPRATEAPRFSKESVTNVWLQGLVLQLLLIVLQEGRPKGVFSIDLCGTSVAALGPVEKESETISYQMFLRLSRSWRHKSKAMVN